MSDQWLHTWFPVVGLLLQVIFWGLYVPRVADHHTIALLTFSDDPQDPNY